MSAFCAPQLITSFMVITYHARDQFTKLSFEYNQLYGLGWKARNTPKSPASMICVRS